MLFRLGQSRFLLGMQLLYPAASVGWFFKE
jgi:hypothetical protein